jgi:hypothetical protein
MTPIANQLYDWAGMMPIIQIWFGMQTYLYSGDTYVSNLFHHVHVTNIPFGKT